MTSGPATGVTPAEQDPPAAPPLAGDDPVERHRLSHQAIWYWRWRAVFSLTPTLLLLCAFAVVAPWGPEYLWWGIAAIYGIVLAVGIVVLPPIRQKVFWYALSAREIDIQHGIIFIKRTVVPMHRVQNLRTERGPVADHYWFTNLTIKTAAGSVTLSALDRVEADDLCNRISRLADVADDV